MSHVKSLYVEIKRDEYEGLRARVAELEQQKAFWFEGARMLGDKCDQLESKQPSAGVVLPVVLPESIGMEERGEYGAAMARGFNACLREVARLNPCRAQSVPDGYVMVPVEPTLDMGWAYVDAANEASQGKRNSFSHPGYRAMIAAAPPVTGVNVPRELLELLRLAWKHMPSPESPDLDPQHVDELVIWHMQASALLAQATP